MLTMLLLGFFIGLNITIFRENKKIKAFEELMTLYEIHEEKLRDRVNYYKDGMNETLKQNIELKRKLSNENSRRNQCI